MWLFLHFKDIGTVPIIPENSFGKRQEEETSDDCHPFGFQDDLNQDATSKVFNPSNMKSKFVKKFPLEPDIVRTPILRLCLLTTLYAKKVCFQDWSGKKSTFYVIQAELSRCNNHFLLFKILNCIQLMKCNQNANYENLVKNNLYRKNKGKTNLPTYKRLPFKAWGGKRFNQVGTEKVQTSKVPFNAWGGKRSYNGINIYNFNSNTDEICKRSKTKFYSWGGKKSKTR